LSLAQSLCQPVLMRTASPAWIATFCFFSAPSEILDGDLDAGQRNDDPGEREEQEPLRPLIAFVITGLVPVVPV
ncbi:MAG TPA: hypothetical protein VD858_14840, partial [Reyranella sp.]|nr:hypothetical protein [Reyranella sp.]